MDGRERQSRVVEQGSRSCGVADGKASQWRWRRRWRRREGKGAGWLAGRPGAEQSAAWGAWAEDAGGRARRHLHLASSRPSTLARPSLAAVAGLDPDCPSSAAALPLFATRRRAHHALAMATWHKHKLAPPFPSCALHRARRHSRHRHRPRAESLVGPTPPVPPPDSALLRSILRHNKSTVNNGPPPSIVLLRLVAKA